MNPKYLFGCSCYFYISVFCFDRFNLSWAGPEPSIPVLPMHSKLWLWLLLQGRCGYGDRGDKHSTQKADFWRSLFKIVQSPYALKFRKTLWCVWADTTQVHQEKDGKRCLGPRPQTSRHLRLQKAWLEKELRTISQLSKVWRIMAYNGI